MSDHGALLSYGADQRRPGHQAVRLAHRILTGAAPGELPVELPDHVERVVNLETARRVGVHVLPEVLLRADRVVE
ncbi:MAG TPA: ABC transporter substrate binding protein [Candidatus Tectomicrobia bacterium]|nr:ABC transporter substrate binding protein [Candidatus Tectomicrobia bacterium]